MKLLARSCTSAMRVPWPASTTHRQLGADELAKAGVSVDMVRLSVGIEHIDDLLEEHRTSAGRI